MQTTHARTAIRCLALLAAALMPHASRARVADVTPAYGSRTIYAEFDLKSLPATVTLCNSGRFLDTQGFDLIWIAGVGFNPVLSTYETLIAAHTPLQGFCGVTSQANLATAVQGGLYHIDPQNFINGYKLVAGLPVTVDVAAGKLLVQADRSEPVLAGLSDSTQARFFTLEAVVTSPGGDGFAAIVGSTVPRDDADPFTFGGSFVDPADDVCTANQVCNSATHPQIDLVGGSLYPEPVQPPPVFGGSTLDIEFDLASLPDTVSLCNSSMFQDHFGYDLIWVAGLGLNVSLAAYETLIAAHTPLQWGCSTPTPVPLTFAMQATLFHLDPQHLQDGYVFVASLPASVDIPAGRIRVQANRAEPPLDTLPASAQAAFFTVESVASSPPGDFSPLGDALTLFTSTPRDDAASFAFGASFTDPASDVCTSLESCASSTHPQIDLVGGSAHMDDYVFRGDFE